MTDAPTGHTPPSHVTLRDVVDPSAPAGRDAWQQPKAAGVPDVTANRILPASYDGQIVLATNTSRFDGSGAGQSASFLASFVGDLDTGTCKGNGREQAKTPNNNRQRVVDTVSLLGVLGDTNVDLDPRETDANARIVVPGVAYELYAIRSANPVMKRLDEDRFWENCSCRMGDLRTEGVWLGTAGLSAKDATLKYLVHLNERNQDFANFDPGARTTGVQGRTVSMWMKPAWRGNDYFGHDLFNAANPGQGWNIRHDNLLMGGVMSASTRPRNTFGRGNKHGSFWPNRGYAACNGTKQAGCSSGVPSLQLRVEDHKDRLMVSWLSYGGTGGTNVFSSPTFRVQPFRWSFVGYRARLNDLTALVDPAKKGFALSYGYLEKGTDTGGFADRDISVNRILRVFIDSARTPEGPDFDTRWHSLHRNQVILEYSDIASRRAWQFPDDDPADTRTYYQEAAWYWQDGGVGTAPDPSNTNCTRMNQPVFSINNLDESLAGSIRASPLGTQAVIDELKITKKAWSTDEIHDHHIFPKKSGLKISGNRNKK